MLKILLIMTFFAARALPQDPQDPRTIPPAPSALVLAPKDSTGIKGYVYLVSGNQMPSPSRRPSSHHGSGVRSVICIFRLTNTGQVVRQGQSPYYTAVNTVLVRQADTDDKGFFSVLLPPGHYSVFTKKGDLFYASRMDEQNNIAPVEVMPGKMTELECRVESDHKPVY